MDASLGSRSTVLAGAHRLPGMDAGTVAGRRSTVPATNHSSLHEEARPGWRCCIDTGSLVVTSATQPALVGARSQAIISRVRLPGRVMSAYSGSVSRLFSRIHFVWMAKIRPAYRSTNAGSI